jgi:protein-disulfide isomerase
MSKNRGTAPKSPVSKRQAIREKRRQQQRRQRLYLILGIGAAALVIAGILIIPSLAPVGDVVKITPTTRPLEDGRALGDPNAPVVIEAYEDFQCPACRTYSTDIEPRVVETYVGPGKAYYIYRHYPFLDNNVVTKESDQSANASMCAGDQGRFWDYHDMLFANWNGENQNAFGNKRLVAFADALGLDMQAFNQCFEENRFAAEIKADEDLAKSFQITGTPTVLVNGKTVAPGGFPTFELISQEVEAALSASSN